MSRAALSRRWLFLGGCGRFADEQQESNAGHGQDARAVTGPNDLPTRCECFEEDGLLNHGPHPMRDGQTPRPRSN